MKNPLDSLSGTVISGFILTVILYYHRANDRLARRSGRARRHVPNDWIFRWFHILAGIMWIGLLYFFNFVNVAAVKEATAAGEAGPISQVRRAPGAALLPLGRGRDVDLRRRAARQFHGARRHQRLRRRVQRCRAHGADRHRRVARHDHAAQRLGRDLAESKEDPWASFPPPTSRRRKRAASRSWRREPTRCSRFRCSSSWSQARRRSARRSTTRLRLAARERVCRRARSIRGERVRRRRVRMERPSRSPGRSDRAPAAAAKFAPRAACGDRGLLARAARPQARGHDRAALGEERAEIDLDDSAARHRRCRRDDRRGARHRDRGDIVAADDVEHDVDAAPCGEPLHLGDEIWSFDSRSRRWRRSAGTRRIFRRARRWRSRVAPKRRREHDGRLPMPLVPPWTRTLSPCTDCAAREQVVVDREGVLRQARRLDRGSSRAGTGKTWPSGAVTYSA